jgi:hypothetical protein
MTDQQLRSIRELYSLSASSIGLLLGYSGPRANIAVTIRRLERDIRRIPPAVEKLAWMYAKFGIPREWRA